MLVLAQIPLVPRRYDHRIGKRVIRVPDPKPAVQGSDRFQLAAMAGLEHEARVRHYPAQVEAGTLARDDAAADIAAWAAIVALLAAGEVETDLGWGDLELAASRAMIRRSEAAEADPANPRLAERRDAVQAIHAKLVWTRWFFTGLGEPEPGRVAA
jgi:hypothetical protein